MAPAHVRERHATAQMPDDAPRQSVPVVIGAFPPCHALVDAMQRDSLFLCERRIVDDTAKFVLP